MGGACGPTGASGCRSGGSASFFGLALFEAIAFAVHLEDVDVVGEPVEERAGEALRAEHLGPLVERQVGGDQDRAALVALGENLEQQLGAGLGERHETQLVDDEELEVGELLLEPQELSVIARFHELVDQGGGGGKADRQALLAGGEAEAERNVTLAGAGIAQSDHILPTLDVLASCQLEDQRLVERGDRFEVKAVQALDGRELRLPDPPPPFMTRTMRRSRPISSSSARRSR